MESSFDIPEHQKMTLFPITDLSMNDPWKVMRFTHMKIKNNPRMHLKVKLTTGIYVLWLHPPNGVSVALGENITSDTNTLMKDFITKETIKKVKIGKDQVKTKEMK